MKSAEQITQELLQQFGENITSANLHEYCRQTDISYQTIVKKIEPHKIGRGVWNLTVQEAKTQLEETYQAPAVMPKTTINLIPEIDENYVPFGNYKDVKKIIQSKIFYPVFITGLSGNGKTKMVEQICANLKREYIRVNLTVESDDDSLIGGFRLESGNTVFFNGPVIEAMERGAILLLDEIDLATPAKIMCLQSILEGNGYLIKKTGRFVKPAPGFNIIATANTKMQGDPDGKFIATNIMNSAFIDRWCLVFEQEYPTPATEKKIIMNFMKSLNCVDEEFADKLIIFAETVRKTFKDGGVEDVVTTRKLIHIIQAFSIFGNRKKAIELTMNIYDQDTKESFVSLYEKIDGNVEEYQDEEVTE